MAQKDPAHSAPSPRFCDSYSCRVGTPLSKPRGQPRNCENNLQKKEATSRSRARLETRDEPEARPPRPEVTKLAPPPMFHTSRDFAKATLFRLDGGHGRLFVSCLFCVAGAGREL